MTAEQTIRKMTQAYAACGECLTLTTKQLPGIQARERETFITKAGADENRAILISTAWGEATQQCDYLSSQQKRSIFATGTMTLFHLFAIKRLFTFNNRVRDLT